MSRNKPRAIVPETPRPSWRRWAAILLLPTVAIVAIWWQWDTPRRLLREAQSIAHTNPAKADELLEQSISAASGHFPEAQLERCFLFAEHHHWAEALGCFSQIANPRECDPLQLIRLAKQALAGSAEYLAELALAAARGRSPGEAEVLRLLIPLNLRHERSKVVLADCARLSELDPVDPMPWLITGRIYNKNREVVEALDAFQKARDRHLDAADLNETRNNMAELYLHEGNLTAARDQLEQLKAIRKPTESDQLKWSYLLRLEGDFEGALAAVEVVLRHAPNHVNALQLRGTLKLDCDQPEQGIADLKRVLELQPYGVEAHSKLGQAYQKLHQPKQAALHLQKSRELIELRTRLVEVRAELQKDPENRDLQRKVAELRKATGDHGAATNSPAIQ